MSEAKRVPVCNACQQPCDVVTQEWGVGDHWNGAVKASPGYVALSFCCKAHYTMAVPEVSA